MTVLGISELNAILVEESNLTPGRILEILNQRIKVNMTNEQAGLSLHDGMDVGVLSLDKRTKQLSFAGANRPLLRIDKDSEVHHYQPTKFPIGHYALDQSDERTYETLPVPFAAGDRLYLFTDGITDQFSEQMKKMGKKGLYDLLAGVHYQPIQFAQVAIEKAINEHKGQHDQTDDIMLLAIA
jgi:phosphoserine phosphatase RsbU/P